jgi:opacity protein-like surface antigen
MVKLKQQPKTGLSMAFLAGLMVLISARAHAQEASEPAGVTDDATGEEGGASGQVEASTEWGASQEASGTETGASSPEVAPQPTAPPRTEPTGTDTPVKEEEEEKTRVPEFFKPVVGNLYFLGGVGFHDTGPLNSRFDDGGFSEIKDPSLSLGIGGDISIGRLILGTEWHRLVNVGTDVARDDFRADIKTRYWLARLGVDLVKWRGLRVYPLFGIGTASTTIRISEEQGADFDAVLATPNRETRMTQHGLLLDASLGADYRFLVRENDEKKRFFTVGLRGGYMFSPHSRGWETAAAEISGGPDLMTTGPTVQLLIGFSGQHKKPYYKRRHHRR